MNEKMVKAKLWKLLVVSQWGAAHGNTRYDQRILEVEVPSYHLSFNIVGDKFHCFRTHERRYSDNAMLVTLCIEVPLKIVEAMDNYLASYEHLEPMAEEWWRKSNINKHLGAPDSLLEPSPEYVTTTSTTFRKWKTSCLALNKKPRKKASSKG
jgi:predicted unusual protein kinase regulating ubiquinone biosynthesis (AarF/ABC1/UbiB family)